MDEIHPRYRLKKIHEEYCWGEQPVHRKGKNQIFGRKKWEKTKRGDNMAYETVYGIREDKGKEQVYSKEQVDELIPVVRTGTGDPDDSLGKNGDIYIKVVE